MLKKLHFDQTKKYEQAIAVHEVSKMLVAFTKGRKHALAIGAEQGDIENWDDLIVQEDENVFKHLQIKRQLTDFSDDPCERDTYKRGERKGQLRDLSAFDETLKSFATWTSNNNPATCTEQRSFLIEVPESSTKIKNEIDIRNFRALVEEHIKVVTTVQGLNDLAKRDASINNCFVWLTTWCEFKDWEHILIGLRVLSIKFIGLEQEIEDSTDTVLSEVFTEPVRVRKEIQMFLEDNATFTGAVTARPLLNLLQDLLLPEVGSWTQFQKNGSNWSITGTHDLEGSEIERPLHVVPLLWSNERVRNLKIDAPLGDSTSLFSNIIQLALHLSGQVNAHCDNNESWRNCISSKIGGTLGTSRTDCENLSIAENPSAFSVSTSKVLTTRSEQDAFADELNKEMLQTTWKEVVKQLDLLVDGMGASELRDAVETRWNIWKIDIGKSKLEQKELFKAILHPLAEGEEIDGELRIGIKTVNLIVEGVHLLLIVCVALNDNVNDWKRVKSTLSVNTIGLNYWSGPASKKRKIREVDDEDGVLDLIGRDPADVLILSKVKLSEAELYGDSLANGTVTETSLASPHKPKLLVTYNRIIRKHIKEGKIEPLQTFLNNLISRNITATNESIQKSI